MITQSTVKHFFSYDPETGEFKRIRFINNQGVTYERESNVRSKHQSGYYMAVILGKRIRVHHLIFLYMMGELPDEVDHINGDRTDNRWVNLRRVERIENQRNQGLRADSVSGHIGVYWYPPLSKYQSQITLRGQRIHLGYYSTLAEAVMVRKGAEQLLGYHRNHGTRPSWQK